jgi:transposase-like protein
MRRRPCLTCENPERARIDYLIARGESIPALARKFGVSSDSLRRHALHHISQEYRSVVQASPLQSLEQLQKLACESGASVVDNLSAIYSALSSRFLSAFEAGDDHRLSLLTGKMHANLELRAKISRELLPGSTNISITNQTNVLQLPGVAGTLRDIARILAPHPEARRAVLDYLRSAEPRTGTDTKLPLLEHAAD